MCRQIRGGHEVYDMLQRLNELSIKVANGIDSKQDRKCL